VTGNHSANINKTNNHPSH